MQFVVWMGEWIKRPVTVRNPIVDAVLPGWLSYQHRLRDRRLQARQQLYHP